MPEEDVLDEVRRVREELARECNYDIDVIFERHRKMRAQLEAEGWKFVDLSAQHAHEAPAAYGKPPESPAES
jgi:hypothetical protein